MINKIWCFFIFIAIIFGFINGSYEEVNNSIFSSINSTIELIFTLFGSMCFWNGIMNIVKNTSLINKIKNILNPLIKFLFPDLSKESEAYKNISINMASNLIGLGNASTPAGLKAMKELQKENKNKKTLSKNMILFMLINTASIQLIPTTIISIRMSLGSKNPSGIILGVWFASLSSFLFIIFITKIYFKFRKEN